MAVCIKFADDWIRTAHNWHEMQATGLPAETQPLASVYLPTFCDVLPPQKMFFVTKFSFIRVKPVLSVKKAIIVHRNSNSSSRSYFNF